jgi:hypothetical protein|mmetsp:Transcript_30692/g.94949  ORF Transcript_30692/g.94949 Transcript_30692/m.94949 type:complete len:503 (+) Transcript_30692:333-1841(+)
MSSSIALMVEALAKAAEIILVTRINSPSELPRVPGRTRFNMEVEEIDVVRGLIEYWRRDIGMPLRLLIVWRPSDQSAICLLERWDLQYTSSERKTYVNQANVPASVRVLWRKFVIILRTLHSLSVTLPAARCAKFSAVQHRRGKKTGSIGFAICTKESDSERWLLLDGNASAAYEPKAPLDFLAASGETNLIELPPARCAFGSWAVTVRYAYRNPSDPLRVASGLPAPMSSPANQVEAKSLAATSPSGLSILLAASKKNDQPLKRNDISAMENSLVLQIPHRIETGGVICSTIHKSNPKPVLLNVPFGLPHQSRSGIGQGVASCSASHGGQPVLLTSTPPFASPKSESPKKKATISSLRSPPFAKLNNARGDTQKKVSKCAAKPRAPDSVHSTHRSQTKISCLGLTVPDQASSPWLSVDRGDEKCNAMATNLILNTPDWNLPESLPPFAFDASLAHQNLDVCSKSSAISAIVSLCTEPKSNNDGEYHWNALRFTLSSVRASK